MLLTQANLDALRVTLEMGFEEGYTSAEPWSKDLFMSIPSSTKSNTYGWLAQQFKLREWIGPRVAQNLSEHSHSITNRSFEGTVEVDRDDIEDDNLGMYQSVLIPQLGEAVKQHPDELLEEVLTNNPVGWDGKALFANDHPTFAPVGSTQTYDNLHALALTEANLATVLTTGSSIVGENGRPLQVRYTHMYVCPALEFTAKQILASQFAAALAGTGGAGVVQVENPLANVVQLRVVPSFAGSTTRWEVYDLSKRVKPFIYQKRRAPQFVSRDNPQDPKVFDVRKFTYGVDLRDAMGYSLPFLAARGNA
jgi:phage major head subunit gpT-like protein